MDFKYEPERSLLPVLCGAKYGTRKKYDKKLDKTRYQCIIQNANELQMHAGCKNE